MKKDDGLHVRIAVSIGKTLAVLGLVVQVPRPNGLCICGGKHL